MIEIDKLAALLTERGYRFIPWGSGPMRMSVDIWKDVINGRWSTITPINILLTSFRMVSPGRRPLAAEVFTAEEAFRMLGAPMDGTDSPCADSIINQAEA